MEHLRLDNQRSPAVSLDLLTQEIFHYVYIRGRCSLIELFPVFARKEGFLQKLEDLLVQQLLFTDLKSIWAREKQIIFNETPLSKPESSKNWVLGVLNRQAHVVGEDFTYENSIFINRDFQIQWSAMQMKPGDRFYLGHFEDFRGRIYCKGHILTYQGTDFQKSLIRCEPYELYDHNDLEWLYRDVARSYGLDKATWTERANWAHQHPDVLNGAKEPFLYHSGMKALAKANRGELIDHLISLDATASGIQCLALMSQDADSAMAVNLGSHEVNNVYRRVQGHMGESYPYDPVKQAVMTSFYESKATPRNLFGEDYPKFVQAAKEMLPGPWLMMEVISSCMTCQDEYQWTMMDGYEVKMEVTQPIECSMDIGKGHVMTWNEHRKAPVATKGLTANVTHSLDALVLREVVRRANCPYEWYRDDQLEPFQELRKRDIYLLEHILRWQQTKFVSVAFLNYVDARNQHLVPQELKNEVDQRTTCKHMYIQPIHDCYRVRAVDAEMLFTLVKEVMADLAYAKTAEWLLPQLGYKGQINDSEEKRTALKRQVLNSRYLIC